MLKKLEIFYDSSTFFFFNFTGACMENHLGLTG